MVESAQHPNLASEHPLFALFKHRGPCVLGMLQGTAVLASLEFLCTLTSFVGRPCSPHAPAHDGIRPRFLEHGVELRDGHAEAGDDLLSLLGEGLAHLRHPRRCVCVCVFVSVCGFNACACAQTSTHGNTPDSE